MGVKGKTISIKDGSQQKCLDKRLGLHTHLTALIGIVPEKCDFGAILTQSIQHSIGRRNPIANTVFVTYISRIYAGTNNSSRRFIRLKKFSPTI